MFAGGLYAHVRHPRYTGMFSAVVGAALLAGTPRLWAILAVWWVFALLVIHLEERELAARFGAAYTAYRKRVPAFLPFRLWTSGNRAWQDGPTYAIPTAPMTVTRCGQNWPLAASS